jgi:UPF0716 protein FxsA
VQFLLLIIVVLIIEMYLLITIGGELGALPTIALVFITAALGLWMLRQQSLSTLRRASFVIARGEAPVHEVAEGAVLLAGGILLLIPGFFTDAVGFLCLFPLSRQLLLQRFIRNAGAGHANAGDGRGAQTIEGEWRRESAHKSGKKRFPRSTYDKP